MDTFPVSQGRFGSGMVCGSAPCTLRFVIGAPFEAYGRPAELVVIHPFLIPEKWCKDFNETSKSARADQILAASHQRSLFRSGFAKRITAASKNKKRTTQSGLCPISSPHGPIAPLRLPSPIATAKPKYLESKTKDLAQRQQHLPSNKSFLECNYFSERMTAENELGSPMSTQDGRSSTELSK